MKKLFYILLFFFPFGEVLRLQVGNGITLLGNDFIVFVLFLCGIFIYRAKIKHFKSLPLSNPLMTFIGICIASLLFQAFQRTPLELLVSSFYIVRFVIYAGLFYFAYLLSEKEKKSLFVAFIISGTATIALGVFQYILYPDLRNMFYLGWDEHLYRLFGTFFDPNFYGIIATIFFLFFCEQIRNTKKTLYIILAFITFVSLLLTYSRGSFIAFGIAVVVYLFLIGKKKFVLGLLLFFLIGIVLIPKNLKSEGVDLTRTASIFARVTSLQQGWRVFADHPILGVGFNTYRYIQKDYGFIQEKDWNITHAGAGTDNSFLFVLATTGIIGGVSYLYLIFGIFRTYRKQAIVVAVLVSVCIHSLFVNSLFYPFVLELLWIILGLSTKKITSDTLP